MAQKAAFFVGIFEFSISIMGLVEVKICKTINISSDTKVNRLFKWQVVVVALQYNFDKLNERTRRWKIKCNTSNC